MKSVPRGCNPPRARLYSRQSGHETGRAVAARLLEQFDISEDAIRRIVSEAVAGADDGELFVEHREGEALVFDNGRLKTANFNTERGFGLRAVSGEASGFFSTRVTG